MKIFFQEFSKDAHCIDNPPIPATKAIPDWYRNMPMHFDGNNKTQISKNPNTPYDLNLTAKGCTPLLDSLSIGYMLCVSNDVQVYKDNNGIINIKWRNTFDPVVSSHDSRQIDENLFENFENHTFKWLYEWHIETPPGYSCIYTHPLNRYDLPFRTFSGVVDTDKYPNAVHFPFKFEKFYDDFVIPAGTPVCQVIPFKRDEWRSEIIPYDEEKVKRGQSKLLRYINKSYKRQFWSKKSYV